MVSSLSSNSAPGGLLTLDLAGTVGACYGHRGVAAPLLRSIVIPDGNYGQRIMAWENALIDLLDELRPSRVIAEAPLPGTAKSNQHTIRWQMGLAAYVHGECARRRIRVAEQRADKARQTIIGKSRVTKADKAAGLTLKDFVVAWCRARGWEPPTHDAADAALLWVFATEFGG